MERGEGKCVSREEKDAPSRGIRINYQAVSVGPNVLLLGAPLHAQISVHYILLCVSSTHTF